MKTTLTKFKTPNCTPPVGPPQPPLPSSSAGALPLCPLRKNFLPPSFKDRNSYGCSFLLTSLGRGIEARHANLGWPQYRMDKANRKGGVLSWGEMAGEKQGPAQRTCICTHTDKHAIPFRIYEPFTWVISWDQTSNLVLNFSWILHLYFIGID